VLRVADELLDRLRSEDIRIHSSSDVRACGKIAALYLHK
jgi:hypothetical protein